MQSSTQEITPAIGTEMEGGTFGGIISVNGTHKGVIWAPKGAGQIIAPLLRKRGHSINGAIKKTYRMAA